jgi:type VI secretion system FHA domain protein
MTLTLSVLRCPDSVAPESRRLQGGELRIGRGADNDWVLADPDRVLSKRHCVIAFRGGAWQVVDTSTNGTFLNRETEPLGAGRIASLQDGDRLRLGAYEIEARIAEVEQAAPARPHFDDPFGDDPFKDGPFRDDSFKDGPFGARGTAATDSPFGDSPALPADFDPFAPAHSLLGDGLLSDDFLGAPVQPDHTPAHTDAFRPPPVTPQPAAPSLLPDDWDDEFLAPKSAPPPPAPQLETPTPAPPAPPRPPEFSPPGSGTGLLAAFLEGAGMPARAPEDAAALMHGLGAAFRALVSELRQTLIARAAVKGEFRIEQTMIRTRGNNPLKFSADDDDALSALLGTGRHTGMTPAAAITDALRDIRLHELATMAAMQEAVRAMLAKLDPAIIQAGVGQGMALPAQKKARAWDAFESLHRSVSAALADDFDSVFGRAFARAYEVALRDAQKREEP